MESPARPVTPGQVDIDILQKIYSKLSVLDTLVEKVDALLTRIDNNEKEIKKINTEITDLHNGYSFLEHETMIMKTTIAKSQADTANKQYVEKLESELVDMSNRLRRNTIILHNVPEGAEGDEKGYCESFAANFIRNEMGVKGTGPVESVLVERAHRQPMGQPDRSRTRPRPIHVKLVLTPDRNTILNRSREMKGVSFKGNRVSISDSLHPKTLELHKKLVEKKKELINAGKWAYIPWTVPRVLKYKEPGRENPWKTYRL